MIMSLFIGVYNIFCNVLLQFYVKETGVDSG